MVAICADGTYLRPTIVCKGGETKRTPKEAGIHTEGYLNANYVMTKGGWMTGESFLFFLECFVEELKERGTTFPVLLTVDG